MNHQLSRCSLLLFAWLFAYCFVAQGQEDPSRFGPINPKHPVFRAIHVSSIDRIGEGAFRLKFSQGTVESAVVSDIGASGLTLGSFSLQYGSKYGRLTHMEGGRIAEQAATLADLKSHSGSYSSVNLFDDRDSTEILKSEMFYVLGCISVFSQKLLYKGQTFPIAIPSPPNSDNVTCGFGSTPEQAIMMAYSRARAACNADYGKKVDIGGATGSAEPNPCGGWDVTYTFTCH